MGTITSLDKCGIFQKQDCLKELCPLWSKVDNYCIADISGTMLNEMARKISLVSMVWKAMDNKQRLETALSALKKITEG